MFHKSHIKISNCFMLPYIIYRIVQSLNKNVFVLSKSAQLYFIYYINVHQNWQRSASVENT